MPYHVTEPHPSVKVNKSAYIQAGRGGAGNMARYHHSDLTQGASATGPASAAKTLPPPPTTHVFTSGRGGAGNTFRHRSDSPRRIFSFDEELAREQKIMDNAAKAPVYRIGRGGAGNMVNENGQHVAPSVHRRSSAWSAAGLDLERTTSNESTASSARSGRSITGVFSRIGRTLSRQ